MNSEQHKVFDSLSPVLIKNLRLATIECAGKILYNNMDLKNKYIYASTYPSPSLNTHDFEELNWPRRTNLFIKTLISYLDTGSVNERDLQLEVLRFIRYITDGDSLMQNRLVSTKNAINSTLINNFRNLLRKSSPLIVRSSAMFSLWALSGDKNYQETHDRKCILYRAVGAQKFVDTLFDSDDELTLICLEALTSISYGPSYRDTETGTNELLRLQDDVGRVHAVPAVLRLSSQII